MHSIAAVRAGSCLARWSDWLNGWLPGCMTDWLSDCHSCNACNMLMSSRSISEQNDFLLTAADIICAHLRQIMKAALYAALTRPTVFVFTHFEPHDSHFPHPSCARRFMLPMLESCWFSCWHCLLLSTPSW